MPLPRIVLSAPSGQTWSSPGHLRLGRLVDLEVSLDDPSVSRLHAEIYLCDEGWVIRDRGSSNGTYVNGVRIGRAPLKLRQGDAIQVGILRLAVDLLKEPAASIRVSGRSVHVEAATAWSWDSGAWTGEGGGSPTGAVRLMQAALRLAHASHPDTALQAFLGEAIRHFQARRCGVFLTEEAADQLTLRSFSAGGHPIRPPGKSLATAAFRRRQSLLFKDATEAMKLESDSAVRGELSSIICALLHTPERVIGVLHIDRSRGQEPFTEPDLDLAESVAAALALALDRQQLVARHQNLFVQTVTALAQAVEMRDRYTGNHTHRVTSYALLLAEELGVPTEQRRQLQVATALHDIGKIAIDDQILRKPERLLPAEFDTMKTHVLRGTEIIQMIPALAWALPVVRGHHERYDGKGYPDGLKGEAIPLAARIVAVADAFDAMTSDRPYRPGMPAARAYGELQTGSGTHFDPKCVEAFVRLRPKIEEMLNREETERTRAAASTATISKRDLDAELARTGDPFAGTATYEPIPTPPNNGKPAT